ncbi:hypothetical protein B7463_g7445, partial [Scytalidium lignicola]
MKNIIIDTDPGVDDALALLYALSLPAELNVLLISLTFGNVSLKQCFCNAYTILETVRKLGLPGPGAVGHDMKTIPLALGQDRPLFTDETVDAAHFHGGDGLGGLHTSHSHLTPPGWETMFNSVKDLTLTQTDVNRPFRLLPHSAHEEILQTLRSHEPGSVTIVAIGPLSNIAKAAISDPATFSRVKEVVVMGGAIDTMGNANPYAEFNTFADPEAAAIVFALTNPRSVALPALPGFDPTIFGRLESSVKVTLVPLDMTRRHHICDDEWEEGCRGSKLADWVRIFCAGNFRPVLDILKVRDVPYKALVAHDALCIWYVLSADSGDMDHNLFKVDVVDLRVETNGQWTRGMCCVDRRPKSSIPVGSKEVSQWVDPGSWLDESLGNRIGVLKGTPGRKEWARRFCLALFGTNIS